MSDGSSCPSGCTSISWRTAARAKPQSSCSGVRTIFTKSAIVAAMLIGGLAGPMASPPVGATRDRVVTKDDPADASELLQSANAAEHLLGTAISTIGRTRGGDDSDPADAGKLLDIA